MAASHLALSLFVMLPGIRLPCQQRCFDRVHRPQWSRIHREICGRLVLLLEDHPSTRACRHPSRASSKYSKHDSRRSYYEDSGHGLQQYCKIVIKYSDSVGWENMLNHGSVAHSLVRRREQLTKGLDASQLPSKNSAGDTYHDTETPAYAS